uniref:Uncharacterized protein n=1 Tax=Arundo donax TaxID=35708 RepID=A0A0A9BQY3_ARUDO
MNSFLGTCLLLACSVFYYLDCHISLFSSLLY